jgi:hypothetical protein
MEGGYTFLFRNKIFLSEIVSVVLKANVFSETGVEL